VILRLKYEKSFPRAAPVSVAAHHAKALEFQRQAFAPGRRLKRAETNWRGEKVERAESSIL